MTLVVLIAALLVFVPMLVETAISTSHDRRLRALGAREPDGDAYRVMAVAYPAVFLAMIGEGAWRRVSPDALAAAGLVLFVCSKALKYWATSTLGDRWTFRVLVPPGSARIVSGPYRWLDHPNYVAVAGELIGVALAMHAFWTGLPGTIFFAGLMLRRRAVEERALREGAP